MRKSLLFVFSAILAAALITGCAGLGKSAAPKRAPDFKVKLMDKSEVTLDSFKGRPLVLNFGSSRCPRCIFEFPAFKEVYDSRKGDAEFLMIFLKSSEDEVVSLVNKNDSKFKVAMDPDGVSGDAYNVFGIPVTFFIDENGNIVDDYFGSISKRELNNRIDELTKKAGK